MKVRFAQAEDSTDISGLMSQLGYEASADLISEKLRLFESNSVDQVFVAENESGELVGVISCHVISLFHQLGACGRITSLVVSDCSRGRGIGEMLIERAERFFNQQNCIKFEVTSGNHRPEAHEFYKSLGYNEDERRFLKLNS